MAINHAKDHSPIGSNRDCHEAAQLTPKRMQIESGEIHVVYGTGCIQSREDVAQFGQMLRRNAARIVVLIEAFQPFVAEGLDHWQV
ncbi:MAG: hypothetical protein WBE72_06170 [Terracidiphilus sp.]